MSVVYHDFPQGTDEWLAARCGLLTASEMKLIITAPPKPETRFKKNGEPYKQREWVSYAENDVCRSHLNELLAQRINKFVEPTFVSFAMERGYNDEALARYCYSEKVAPVKEVGFITNDKWGFTLGYSPDGLVGDDGLYEAKSRMPKYQVETILSRAMPSDFLIQVQTGLAVSERRWLDFNSYSGGMPMYITRIYPDEKVQDAIIDAASQFEKEMSVKMADYYDALEEMKLAGLYFETERQEEEIRV